MLTTQKHNRHQENFPFLKLPPEIRNMVYKLVTVAPAGTALNGLASPVLAQVNRLMRKECLPIFYGENDFILSIRRGPSESNHTAVMARFAAYMDTLKESDGVDLVKSIWLHWESPVTKEHEHCSKFFNRFGRGDKLRKACSGEIGFHLGQTRPWMYSEDTTLDVSMACFTGCHDVLSGCDRPRLDWNRIEDLRALLLKTMRRYGKLIATFYSQVFVTDQPLSYLARGASCGHRMYGYLHNVCDIDMLALGLSQLVLVFPNLAKNVELSLQIAPGLPRHPLWLLKQKSHAS